MNKIYIKKKEELENLKLIVNDEEFNIKKNEYYNEVANFENDVANFNNHYEKEIALVREQAQIDILTKDQELGRLYKMINELESRNNKPPETSGEKWVQGYNEWKKQSGKKV